MALKSFLEGSSDQQLMLRVQDDHSEAFGLLYDRHWAAAMSVAQAVCHNRGRAEEAVQEAFLSIWRGRHNYRPAEGSFRAWSMSIVRFRAIDVQRRANKRREEPEAEAAEPEAFANGERDALLDALRQLPTAQAEVIALAYYGGLTHSEIASQLTLPAGTVKGRMRLGLDKLRAEMDPAETRDLS